MAKALAIAVNDGKVMVDNATVVGTDVMASTSYPRNRHGGYTKIK